MYSHNPIHLTSLAHPSHPCRSSYPFLPNHLTHPTHLTFLIHLTSYAHPSHPIHPSHPTLTLIQHVLLILRIHHAYPTSYFFLVLFT